ncbi:hypothetical protein PO909_019026 [Leuciscus waleckii]
MALTAIILLCFAALLPFPGLGERDHSGELKTFPVKVIVINDRSEKISYSTTVTEGWTMFGALNELQDSNSSFKFTSTNDKHYGIFLESVNGLPGSKKDNTYWQLLSQKPGGDITPLEVGMGCYQPQEYENLILEFTKYHPKRDLFHHDL